MAERAASVAGRASAPPTPSPVVAGIPLRHPALEDLLDRSVTPARWLATYFD